MVKSDAIRVGPKWKVLIEKLATRYGMTQKALVTRAVAHFAVDVDAGERTATGELEPDVAETILNEK